jgi:hypothetical protein
MGLLERQLVERISSLASSSTERVKGTSTIAHGGKQPLNLPVETPFLLSFHLPVQAPCKLTRSAISVARKRIVLSEPERSQEFFPRVPSLAVSDLCRLCRGQWWEERGLVLGSGAPVQDAHLQGGREHLLVHEASTRSRACSRNGCSAEGSEGIVRHGY